MKAYLVEIAAAETSVQIGFLHITILCKMQQRQKNRTLFEASQLGSSSGLAKVQGEGGGPKTDISSRGPNARRHPFRDLSAQLLLKLVITPSKSVVKKVPHSLSGKSSQRQNQTLMS